MQYCVNPVICSPCSKEGDDHSNTNCDIAHDYDDASSTFPAYDYDIDQSHDQSTCSCPASTLFGGWEGLFGIERSLHNVPLLATMCRGSSVPPHAEPVVLTHLSSLLVSATLMLLPQQSIVLKMTLVPVPGASRCCSAEGLLSLLDPDRQDYYVGLLRCPW